MNNSSSRLIKNTIALYALSFSSQLINLLLIPFETRVLGAEAYGVLSLGVSLSIILSLVFDFGFILSATERVVSIGRNHVELSSLLSNVSAVKVLIVSFMLIPLVMLLLFIAPFRDYPLLFFLYYIAYAFNALLPDFIYRGLEDMKTVSVRTVAVRIVCSIPIFFTVDGPGDIVLIPLFLCLGNAIAVIVSFIDLHMWFQIVPVCPKRHEMQLMLKRSAPFFISRFASTFYQSMNAVIMSVLYPGQAIVGCYSAAEKFLAVTRQLSSPIADSFYPYMIRTKNYRVCIATMVASAPFIIILTIVCFTHAETICALFFGADYTDSANLLRALLPAITVILPTYLICFPMLIPMGLSSYANASNVIGAVFQVGGLLILWLSGSLNAVTLCLASSFSEVIVFLFRLVVMLKHRDRMKPHTKHLESSQKR